MNSERVVVRFKTHVLKRFEPFLHLQMRESVFEKVTFLLMCDMTIPGCKKIGSIIFGLERAVAKKPK